MDGTSILMIKGDHPVLGGLYFPSDFLFVLWFYLMRIFFPRSELRETRVRVPEPALVIKRPPSSAEIPHFRQKIGQKIIRKKISHKGYDHHRGRR